MMVLSDCKLKNKSLDTATKTIAKAMSDSVKNYWIIGSTLNRINVDKLYKDDFGSFPDYASHVFGISKSTAYRMISVSQKFLAPEMSDKNAKKIFTPFEDTALAALNTIGDYDTTAEFIADNNITPDTPVAAIRKIVKKYQSENAEETEIETTAEETETIPLYDFLVDFSEMVHKIEKSPANKRGKTKLFGQLNKIYNQIIDELMK